MPGMAVSRLAYWYRFLYAVGFTPWEQDTETVAPQLRTLLAREEADRDPPYGSALDLGCGTGRWSVELAQRGWDVTGIDLTPKAVLRARQRAEQAGVDAHFVEGSVTALRQANVGIGFRLLLDVECFNHLSDEQRAAVGKEVDAVARPDAAILLLVWARARRGPLPPGATSDDVAAAFAGWHIVNEEPYQGVLPRPLRGANPRWYRLVRSSGSSG